MNKDQIKTLLEIIKTCGGSYECYILPSDYISSAKKCYNIYYGGHFKMDFHYDDEDHHWSIRLPKLGSINFENIDEAIESVSKVFDDSIKEEFHQAMENLGWKDDYEMLKYFDRDEHKKDYEKLKKEVKRLRKLKQK